MKKQVARGGLLVALVFLLGFGALWWSAMADAVTRDNASRIKPGMSLKAVNELLGQQGQPVDDEMPRTGGENYYVWEGARGTIRVAFRGDLTATDPAQFRAMAPPSFRARLLVWLGW